MKEQLLLGVDMGTTNAKGALFTPDGRAVAMVKRKHGVSRPHPGWAEHDADLVWWEDLAAVCRELLGAGGVEASQIAAVGISALFPAMLPLDDRMRPLRPAMLYAMDTRASGEIGLLNKELGEDYSARVTGKPLLATSIAPKILWLRRNEPGLFARTAKFAGTASYLVYRLTGNLLADYASHKLGGLPFSGESFGWDGRTCEACGISPGQLPDLAFSTERAGVVSEQAAGLTGLAPGTPVAVGTGDFLAEALSNGTAFLGQPQSTYGTTIGFDPGNDHGALLFSDYASGGPPSRPGGAMANGCSTIDWCLSLFPDISGQAGTTALDEQAARVPAGADGLVVLPYLNGERTPFSDPGARGAVFGLTTAHGREHLYRAVLEGVAYSVRHMLESCRGSAGEAVATGGGTRNALLMQIVSDVTGMRQTVLKSFHGALAGDAFMAGMACGMFKERSDIDAWVETDGAFEPDPGNKAVYDERYRVFRDLYGATSPLMHQTGQEK